MKIKVEKPIYTHDAVLPGKCIAVFEVAKQSKDNNTKQVCLQFSINTDEGHRILERSFPADLTVGSQLDQLFNQWLDADFEWLPDDGDEINLDCVIGEIADVVLVNGHEVGGVYSPGTFL